jgi:group I intron endonuclease
MKLEMAKKEPKGYVYKITNNINDRWYIGSHDGHNPYYMGSGKVLKLAIKKHGIENFTKEILFYSEKFKADETQILVELDAANDPNSYNLINTGEGGMLGLKHSKETKEKLADAWRGERNPNYQREYSDEERKAMSERQKGEKSHMWGKHLSDETKQHLRELNLGENNPMYGVSPSAETREKQAVKMRGENNPNWGKDFSEETRAKMSAAKKGENHPLWGLHLSDEYKKKISEAKTGVPQQLAECPVCGEIGGISNMKRWHFDNCGKEFKQPTIKCPHCNKVGGNAMKIHHFDNCPFKRKKLDIDPSKEFLTTTEVMELFSIRKRFVYAKVKDGTIPSEKVRRTGIQGAAFERRYPVKEIIKKFGLEED